VGCYEFGIEFAELLFGIDAAVENEVRIGFFEIV